MNDFTTKTVAGRSCPSCGVGSGIVQGVATKGPAMIELQLRCDRYGHRWTLSRESRSLGPAPRHEGIAPQK